MLSFTVCDLINSEKKSRETVPEFPLHSIFRLNAFKTVQEGAWRQQAGKELLSGDLVFFHVWVQVLKSHGGSRTIGHSIPVHASPFALLQGSTAPKVNSYGTHLGRNGDFQKRLGLPSDYQTTETRVPKI